VEPFVGIESPGFDHEELARQVWLGGHGRTAARAVAAQHSQSARPDVLEDRRFPVIVSALRWMKMTVENAVPDCGRQRLQWQRPSTIGFSVIL
jgi:hypothetical protein